MPRADTKSHAQTPYRGYSLLTYYGTGITYIYHGGSLIDKVTLLDKGMHRTTTDAAKSLIDSWMDAR